MQKLRYLAYDFTMKPFEKKGQLILPEFEKGLILVREVNTEITRIANLYLMKRPHSYENEFAQIFCDDFSIGIGESAHGCMRILEDLENKGKFEIAVKSDKQSKGYGTVLMNAGAKYGSEVGLKTINGKMTSDKDIFRREKFYESLGVNLDPNEKFIWVSLAEPKLNQINFEKNQLAESVLNSMPILQKA